jgi:hypothetical protein
MTFSQASSLLDDEMGTGLSEVLESLDARTVPFRVTARGGRWEPLQALRPEGPRFILPISRSPPSTTSPTTGCVCPGGGPSSSH